MYCVEWDDDFGEIATSAWTDDKEFIKGMYDFLVAKGNSGIRIVEKIDVTDSFLNK